MQPPVATSDTTRRNAYTTAASSLEKIIEAIFDLVRKADSKIPISTKGIAKFARTLETSIKSAELVAPILSREHFRRVTEEASRMLMLVTQITNLPEHTPPLTIEAIGKQFYRAASELNALRPRVAELFSVLHTESQLLARDLIAVPEATLPGPESAVRAGEAAAALFESDPTLKHSLIKARDRAASIAEALQKLPSFESLTAGVRGELAAAMEAADQETNAEFAAIGFRTLPGCDLDKWLHIARVVGMDPYAPGTTLEDIRQQAIAFVEQKQLENSIRLRMGEGLHPGAVQSPKTVAQLPVAETDWDSLACGLLVRHKSSVKSLADLLPLMKEAGYTKGRSSLYKLDLLRQAAQAAGILADKAKKRGRTIRGNKSDGHLEAFEDAA